MRCKQCGQKLSKGQTVCPSCGSAVPKRKSKKLWGVLAVILFVVIVSAVLIFFNIQSRSELPELSFDTVRNLFTREKAETVEAVAVDPLPVDAEEEAAAEEAPEEADVAAIPETAEAEDTEEAEPAGEELTAAEADALPTEEAAPAKAPDLSALTPLEYYQQVETLNFARVAGALRDGYANYAEAVSAPVDRHVRIDYRLDLGDLGRAIAAQLWEINTDWLQNLTLSVDGDILENRTGANTVLSLNDISLLGLDLVYDAAENRISLHVPELDERWFAVDMAELEAKTTEDAYDLSYGCASREQLAAVVEALPSAEDFELLLQKYFNLIIQNISQVELGSGILEAEGVLQRYTTLTADIDEETAIRIVSSVIGELRWDEQVEQYIRVLAEAAGEDPGACYDRFLADLDEFDYEISCSVLGDEFLRMTLYVDGDGSIRGRSLRLISDYDTFLLSYAFPQDGERFGLELRYADGYDLYELAGRGIFAEDSLSGSFILREDAESLARFTVESQDYGEDKTELSVTVVPGRSFYDDFLASVQEELRSSLDDLSLVFRADNLSKDFSMEMDLLETAEQILALTVTESFGESGEIAAVEDAVSADEWAAGISRESFNGILENLKEAGLPSSLQLYVRAYLGYLFNEG